MPTRRPLSYIVCLVSIFCVGGPLWAKPELATDPYEDPISRCPFHRVLRRISPSFSRAPQSELFDGFVFGNVRFPQIQIGMNVSLAAGVAEGKLSLSQLLHSNPNDDQVKVMARKMDLAHSAFHINRHTAEAAGPDDKVVPPKRFADIWNKEARNSARAMCRGLAEVLPQDVAGPLRNDDLPLEAKARHIDRLLAAPAYRWQTDRYRKVILAIRTALNAPAVREAADRFRKSYREFNDAMKEGDIDRSTDVFMSQPDLHTAILATVKEAAGKHLQKAHPGEVPDEFFSKVFDATTKYKPN